MKLILLLLAGVSALSLSADPLKIKRLEMDRGTLKVAFDDKVLFDKGPLVAFLVNRLVKGKYRYYQEYKGPGPIAQSDLVLFKRAARYLPERERDALIEALRKYAKDPGSLELATAVFEALESGLRTGWPDYVLQTMTSEVVKEGVDGVAEEIELLRKKMDQLNELNGGNAPTDPQERVILAHWRSRLAALKTRLDSAPTSRDFKFAPAPLAEEFGVSFDDRKSRTSLSNTPEEIAEFLKQTEAIFNALDEASAARPGTGPSGTHR